MQSWNLREVERAPVELKNTQLTTVLGEWDESADAICNKKKINMYLVLDCNSPGVEHILMFNDKYVLKERNHVSWTNIVWS